MSGEVSVVAKGAIGDGALVLDGSVTSGSPIITSSTANWSGDVVGKRVWVNFPSTGSNVLVPSTIIARDSATQIRASTNALSSVTNCAVVWGTDSTTAFQNAFSAAVASVSATTANRPVIRVPGAPGAYLVSARIYNNQGTSTQSVGPAIIGDGKTQTAIWMAPDMTIPGDGSGVLIHNVGYGARFQGFSVSGCYRMFPLLADQDIWRITQAQAFVIEDVTMGAMGATADTSAMSIRGSGHWRIGSSTIQGGVAGTSAMTAMKLITSNGTVDNTLVSNFPRNLLVSNNPGRDPETAPLLWLGGGVDETAGLTPCRVMNGGQINFVGSVMYGSTDAAIYVDGTSKAWVIQCNVGRYQGYTGTGKALVSDAGAVVYSQGTTWRGTGGGPAFFMANGGTFRDLGGNDYLLYTAANTFTTKTAAECFSPNLPVAG